MRSPPSSGSPRINARARLAVLRHNLAVNGSVLPAVDGDDVFVCVAPRLLRCDAAQVVRFGLLKPYMGFDFSVC